MNSNDLRADQFEKIVGRLLSMLHYLDKLRSRMAHRAFPDDDPLWLTVVEGRNAIQKTITEVRQMKVASKRARAGDD